MSWLLAILGQRILELEASGTLKTCWPSRREEALWKVADPCLDSQGYIYSRIKCFYRRLQGASTALTSTELMANQLATGVDAAWRINLNFMHCNAVFS